MKILLCILAALGVARAQTAVTPDGKYLLSVGNSAVVVTDLAAGKELSRTPAPEAFLGIAMNKAGDKVYVGAGASVLEFAFANGKLTPGRTFPLSAPKDRSAQDFAGDVKFAPDGHLLYVADVFRDRIVVMNPQSGYLLQKIKTGRRPFRILFHPDGKLMYVSSWADGTIGEYDVNTGQRLDNVPVAPHPLDILWVDGPPPADPGSYKARLFVPAANTNSVYVLGVSETGELTKLEALNLSITPTQPLGAAPSAAALSADKKLIYVACSGLNALAVIDISGDRNIIKGFLPAGQYPTAATTLPNGKLAVLSTDAVQLLPANAATTETPPGFAYKDEMPAAPAAPTPYKHVIYVIPGAPGRNVNLLTAGIATDYTMRLGDSHAEDQDPANYPPAGYLWNAAAQAGLKLRNYGFEVRNLAKPTPDGEQIDRVYDPALASDTDMEYRGPDPAYSDTDRAKEFATELKEYEQVGDLPQLLIVRIGDDKEALNIISEAVRQSKFRDETALEIGGKSPLSTLHTVETILGLRPLTIFDAAASR